MQMRHSNDIAATIFRFTRGYIRDNGIMGIHLNSFETPGGGVDRKYALRHAVLLLFADPPQISPRFGVLSLGEWKRLLRWMDISGMTVYFLDRAEELGLATAIPSSTYAQMKSRLESNRERTAMLMADSVDIQAAFRREGVPYALAKGNSYNPDSVPKLWLRSQTDLDFLVAKECAENARRVLEDRGYKVRKETARIWEFATDHIARWGAPEDAYRPRQGRRVELHLETDGPDTRLARRLERDFNGVKMPVLSPPDIFIGQALHCYRNICSQYSRLSQYLEFYRHAHTRRNDVEFWCQVRALCGNDPSVAVRIGASLRLMTELMGDFAPDALTAWTMDRLSPAAHLWFELYSRRKALGSPPGTKLHLLLQEELRPIGVASDMSTRRILFPIVKPPVIVYPTPQENFAARFHRYSFQARFVLYQARFHIVEIVRISWHSMRWQKLVARQEQTRNPHANKEMAMTHVHED